MVRLADAPAPIDPTTGRVSGGDVSRVLDVDLQSVVNGLWAGGAEAVAVNGQRLTALTTIRAAGSAILVDFRPVTSPYEVSAIGPDDLERPVQRLAAGPGDAGPGRPVRSGLLHPQRGRPDPARGARPGPCATPTRSARPLPAEAPMTSMPEAPMTCVPEAR